MKRIAVILAALWSAVLPASACAAETIMVAAASSLAAVGAPLKAAFGAKYPGSSIEFVFGASGALATQIQNGAPFQVFLSADLDFPQRLFDGGWATSGPRVYTRGALILLSVRPRDFSKGLALLADPTVAQFALANPEIAPFGKAARETLVKAGLWEAVKGKAVTAQTANQALQFTLSATGLGFVSQSALSTKELAAYAGQRGVRWMEVDPRSHAPIDQGFVVLKAAASNPTALRFAAFLLSSEARKIFAEGGYAVP